MKKISRETALRVALKALWVMSVEISHLDGGLDYDDVGNCLHEMLEEEINKSNKPLT